MPKIFLLFQLLIVALSVSIFSLYSKKQKQKKLADFIIFFVAFSKFCKNKKLCDTNFWNFDHSLTFLGVMWGPKQNLGPIGWAILTFIGYKQTTNRQAKYIYRLYPLNSFSGSKELTKFIPRDCLNSFLFLSLICDNKAEFSI